jgi:multidrug efflux pump subunit AcrA (membrane-fusion protein)
MTFRKSWIIAVLIIIVSFFAFKYISGGKKKISKRHNSSLMVVQYQEVENKTIPLIVEATGQLKAKNTFDLYSEVTGVLKTSSNEFRTGTAYKKGDVMISIDDTEAKAQLFSQRSEFLNLVTGILPDIKIEFPDQFDKWVKYLKEFDIEKSIRPLPKTVSDKEKYFVSGKKIYTQYYAIKNLEARFRKYRLRAPFDGVVTQADLKPGGLVRSGQKIGVFSNTDLFELEISINSDDAEKLRIGDEVDIFDHDNNKITVGKIIRINAAIDLASQTVSVFAETSGKELKAGMYLNVKILASPVDDATTIERSNIHDNHFVYLVKDSTLVEYEINTVKYNEKTVIVDNLHNGDKLVVSNLSGAYHGMRVIPQKK